MQISLGSVGCLRVDQEGFEKVKKKSTGSLNFEGFVFIFLAIHILNKKQCKISEVNYLGKGLKTLLEHIKATAWIYLAAFFNRPGVAGAVL